MSLAEKRAIFTYQDLQLYEPDQYRHEIVEGEQYMSPSPSIIHQRIVRKLGIFLSSYVEKYKLGEIFISPIDVVFHDVDVSVPDIFFISNENSKIIKEKNIQGAPNLIIEVLSPNSIIRDKQLKYKQYTYYGVEEYWIINHENKLVEIHDLRQSKLIKLVSANHILNTPIFPNLNLPVETIFTF